MNLVGTCNEKTRHEWVERKLKDLPPGARILDAGAGERPFQTACRHLEYVSQDFAKYDGAGNDVGLQTGEWNRTGHDIVGDVAAIPEPDASFDAILCTEVFEHIPHPVETMTEFARLLKPGGVLIITAPFCSMTHFAPYHFYTGFNTYFYEHYLPKLGFHIAETARNGNYFEYLAQELRRLPSVGMQYARLRRYKWEAVASMILLRMLKRYSDHDGGSDELMCFGLHVFAKKQ